MTDKIPSLVAALAEQVKMTPIAWKEYPDCIVIVFQEGPKISFDRALADLKPPRTARTVTPVAPIKPAVRTTRKGR
jgi:hypothetical protein